jgi:hypothetical protein
MTFRRLPVSACPTMTIARLRSNTPRLLE